MIKFYDEEYELFGIEPLRSNHNGKPGGPDEKIIYIRNDDPSKFYSNLIVSYENESAEDYGIDGSTGWSVKFLYGSRKPSEKEWDSVSAGQSISLPDIGSSEVADTTTYHPIWIRVYCPGDSAVQRRLGQKIRLYFSENNVGA